MIKLLLPAILLASLATSSFAQDAGSGGNDCGEVAKLAAIVMVYRQAGESPAEAAGFLNRISDSQLKIAVQAFTAQAFAMPQLPTAEAREKATKDFSAQARLACEAKSAGHG